MKKLSAFVIAGLISLSVISQVTDELKEYFSEGQYFFNRKEYNEALYYYLKCIEEQPDNANFNFKVGETYLLIKGKEHLAVPFLEKSINRVVPKKEYNKRLIEEKNAPLHAYFYLGNAYRMNNQLDEALEAYNSFIESPHFYGNYNQTVVENEMMSCERAKIIQDTPIEYEKVNLGEMINTSSAELNPVVSSDGSVIVFTRRLKFYDAILCSRKEDDRWGVPVNINPQIISDGDFYPTGLSSDGNTLLLVKVDGENSNIYISHFNDSIWSVAQKMPGSINTISQEVHASFGLDDQVMYLASNRKGGKGGFDIYQVEKKPDGTWKKPKNLGKEINSEFDEATPFFCTNRYTLFFSSEGHYNMGGQDIFYAYNRANKWSVPINLGYPINNTSDNNFYCPSEDCTSGYYSISDDDGFGESDIYLIRIKDKMTFP